MTTRKSYDFDVFLDLEDISGNGIRVDLTFDCKITPGRPAFTPRGEYAPIDPPEPPEVEIVEICLNTKPLPQKLHEEIIEQCGEWVIQHILEEEGL